MKFTKYIDITMFSDDQGVFCAIKDRAEERHVLGPCNMHVIVLVVFAVVVEGESVDDKVDDNEVDDIVVEAVLVGGDDELRVLPAIETFEQADKMVDLKYHKQSILTSNLIISQHKCICQGFHGAIVDHHQIGSFCENMNLQK